MKSISLFAFIIAFACTALFISSANAGGHHHGTLGLSSSATSTTSTSLLNGRSPLGEPVFLIPATSTSGTHGGPIGGYVGPRTPLPPLVAPPSTTNTASLGSSAAAARSGAQGAGAISVQSQRQETTRSTHVIFTPPPTFVGVSPSVNGPANAAAANRAEKIFSGSMLDVGLGAGSTESSATKTGSGVGLKRSQ